MKHLEYKDTNNKAYKAYYDKFKKMVKQDLSGDGWFLLVKDFPFKDGENLMFSAGEDIGKWQDKNLVSLYGKTKYIIGRCRKKGPVLTLLDFREGDYVKEATESGLRKELKEYFKGTGVSVRTFKSLKVTEQEPDAGEEDAPEPEETTTEEEAQASTGAFEELAMPKLTPTALKAFLDKAINYAKSVGVLDKDEFVNAVNAFKKAVPNMGRMKAALTNLNEYLANVEPSSAGGQEAELPEEVAELKVQQDNYLTQVISTIEAGDELSMDMLNSFTTAYQKIDRSQYSDEASLTYLNQAKGLIDKANDLFPKMETAETEIAELLKTYNNLEGNLLKDGQSEEAFNKKFEDLSKVYQAYLAKVEELDNLILSIDDQVREIAG